MEKEMLRGSLELLILSRIQAQDAYGGQILKEILKDIQEVLVISEGTLYALLKRLEKKAWIQSYWGDAHLGARRKYYRISPKGTKAYEEKLANWRVLNTLIEGGHRDATRELH